MIWIPGPYYGWKQGSVYSVGVIQGHTKGGHRVLHRDYIVRVTYQILTIPYVCLYMCAYVCKRV